MSAFDQPPRDALSMQARNATLGVSERYRKASLAESWYLSTQYVDLQGWEADVPLARKRPREIIPLYKTIIDTVRRWVFSGDRFPRIAVNPTVDPDADEDEIGPRVDADQAKHLESFVKSLIDNGRLDRCAKEMATTALITSSCAVIVGLQGGYVTYHVEPGKHCTPTFRADNPREVESLEILYQAPAPEGSPALPPQLRGTAGRLYWIRRIIDQTTDTLFKPVEVRPSVAPEFEVDKKTTHGLGFCPVKWVRTMPSSVNDIDGQSVIDPALYPLFSRINYIYSQASRALEYALDPQWVRKNVSQGSRMALAKHPGKIWDIEDESPDRQASISVMEPQGHGVERAGEHLQDLRARICEACSVVLSDPHKIAGKVASGVVLEYMHAPMISLAADLRRDLGADGVLGVINIAMRVCFTKAGMGENVWIPGIRKAVGMMKAAQLAGVWLDFPLEIQWPKYFAPSAQDVGFAVQAATAAKDGKLVGGHAATRFVAEYFGITDVGAEVDTVEDESVGIDRVIKSSSAEPSAVVDGDDIVNDDDGDEKEAVTVNSAKKKKPPKLKPVARTSKSKA